MYTCTYTNVTHPLKTFVMLLFLLPMQNNPALQYKAGQRRPLPAPIPTEYQLQFTWKTSDEHREGPLLTAERLLNNGGVGKRKGGRGKESGREGGRREGGGRENGTECEEGTRRGGEQGERRPPKRRGKRGVRVLADGCNLPSQDLKKHTTSLSKGTCTCMHAYSTCTCTYMYMYKYVCVLVDYSTYMYMYVDTLVLDRRVSPY